MKIKSFDIFMFFNIILFLLMCVFVYYDRFIVYRGSERILEFYVYALLTLSVISTCWIYFRHYEINLLILCLIEFGILIHFAGGLVNIEGKRLYDNFFYHIRYDKYVHFVNSFIACVITRKVLNNFGFSIKRFDGFVVILIILGMGAIIEIVEYIVVSTVPGAGVGGYDNNMQDMIANFAGGIFYSLMKRFTQKI